MPCAARCDSIRAAALCATDASSSRQVPIGVVIPRGAGARRDGEVCRRHGAPILSHGGGTSRAGHASPSPS